MDNDTEERWEQLIIVHCPDPKCKGMLLQSNFEHYEKCTNCGKKFMEISNYVEVK